MSNENTYHAGDVVDEYANLSHLQKPEQSILNVLKDRLPGMAMLDIGVGGGRTTVHFAKLVRKYVGVDYSSGMVDACRKRFADWPSHLSFATCDVRDMSCFADGSFDFVLFSFNGLDYISHEDRLKSFAEIRRVGKSGAAFCFSSHNLQNAPNLFNLRRCLSFNPRKTWEKLRFLRQIRRANPGVTGASLAKQPFAVFNDGAHGFRLKTYYIKPVEQIRQLSEHFKDVSAYMTSWGGKKFETEAEMNTNQDAWTYYLCTMK